MMTSIVPSQCAACLRVRASGWQCDAYPSEIPADMLRAGGDHREPRPGDHGLQFEQARTAGAREAFAEWDRTFGSA